MKRTRVGIVGMWQETNTYSARSTTWDEFADFELLAGSAIVTHHADTRSVIAGFLEIGGTEVVPVFSAGAWPAGPASRETGDRLLAALDRELEVVGELDAVLVNLHGSMVTVGHPDFEADTVQTIRRRLGDVPVVCVLDLHANPSPGFVADSNVVISYDTYPHADMFERGVEAARFMERLLAGEPLETRIGKSPLLTTPLAQRTDQAPMLDLISFASDRTGHAGLERCCVAAGFPYSDVERAGMSVLVTGHTSQRDVTDRVIQDILQEIDRLAPQFAVRRDQPDVAVRAAMAARTRPVVVVDVADNVGGGSPGDGTVLLQQFLDAAANRVLCTIADAEVASQAHRVGVGGTVVGLLGARTDSYHGEPITISAEVLALSDGRYRTTGSWATGQGFDMGATAWLRIGGADVVVTERAVPPFHAEQVTHLGIDPRAMNIIVVKGAVAWRSAFGCVAHTVIEVDTPGTCPIDLSTLSRTTSPMRYP